jgi:hypothetical protein
MAPDLEAVAEQAFVALADQWDDRLDALEQHLIES